MIQGEYCSTDGLSKIDVNLHFIQANLHIFFLQERANQAELLHTCSKTLFRVENHIFINCPAILCILADTANTTSHSPVNTQTPVVDTVRMNACGCTGYIV